jgi:hypothetical protein
VDLGVGFEMTDPQTRDEWQQAVDAAKFFLAMQAARVYGLVEGGPVVNVPRCVDILDRGKARGILPAPDAIERGVEEFCA